MKNRPLLLFTLCWLAGSGCAAFLPGVKLLLLWVGITLLLSVFVFWYRDKFRLMMLMWIAMTVSGLYWVWADAGNVTSLPQYLQMDADKIDGQSIKAKGVIVSAVDVDGDRADFEVMLHEAANALAEEGSTSGNSPGVKNGSVSAGKSQTLSEKVIVQVRLLSKEEQLAAGHWQRGDLVELNGVLELPSTARNFGGFDYQKYLQTQQIHWLYKVKGGNNAVVRPPASWNLSMIYRWNDQARNTLGSKIDQLYKEPDAGYMKGLIIGMADDIDPQTYSQFSQLGLTHILAISGMHVAVFVASILFILSLCRISREKSLTIVIILIPIYVLLSGMSPSVIRAGIMGMIGLYAAKRGMLKDGLNILAAAAMLMLLWNPYYLHSVSFQLSFLVTAGLMIYVPLTQTLLSFMPKPIAGAAGVTLVAQLVSFPMTIYYFNQFSLLSFVANFFLVPVISFIVLPLGAASLVIGSLWLQAGKWLAWAVELINSFTFRLIEWMNDYPSFVTIWRSPSFLWIAAYYALLYLLLYMGKKWIEGLRPIPLQEDDTVPLQEGVREEGQNRMIRNAGASVIKQKIMLCSALGAFMILIYIGYQPKPLHGAGLVQFIDVGQGDSILITTPGGKNILVDGGGTLNFRKAEDGWKERRKPFEVGDKVVVPLLKQRGIHKLDAVIVSHGDQDHAGGLQAVLEQIPVKSFIFNGTLTGTASLNKLLNTALDKRIPMYAAHQGMELKPDKHTTLTFMYPEDGGEQDKLHVEKNQNHASVVFMLRMNEGSFLFTGDMDKAAESDILQQGYEDIEGPAPGSDKREKHGVAELPEWRKGIQVIKIAHHGSKTSSSADWLSQWKPEAAVISVGVNNLYHHPNEDVVKRIVDEGAFLYRTDLQGEIQMKVKKGVIYVRTKLLTNS